MSCIPNSSSIFVHTSNILKWNIANISEGSSQETAHCIQKVIECWTKNQTAEVLRTTEELSICCKQHHDPIKDSEREDIQVTAKLFLFNDDPETVKQAIDKILQQLGLQDIETLVISLSSTLSKGKLVNNLPCMGLPQSEVMESTAESLLKIWPVLEEFIKSNRVFRLGVCNMAVDQLKTLCQSVNIPPKVNQVFLGSTCFMCEELETFAKQHDIQLLSHQDKTDILTENQLKNIIGKAFSEADSIGWYPLWVIRYSEFFKQRGVVRSKGYTMHAKRTVN